MDNGELKAMVSKGVPQSYHAGDVSLPPSNEDLKPERLMNYELSWKHRFNTLTYGINFFYLKGDNMIQTMPVDGKPRNVNTGKVENYGAELEAAYRISQHWNITTNHALLHMKNPVLAAPKYKGFLGANYNCHRLGCRGWAAIYQWTLYRHR